MRKRAPAEVSAKKEDSRLKYELAEAREQQAATSELLKVIGRSKYDLQPVFETLAENAGRLCEAERSFIFRFDGEYLRVVATHNVSAENRAFVEQNPILPGRGSATARAALEQRTVHVLDAQTDPEYTYGSRQLEPIRTLLTVPMLKADEMLGVILVYRHEVRPFTDSQIALLETFADQAVIAIENVSLFDEVQARTEDLRESLQQQTATADVLKVISGSTFDLQTVLQTLVESAARLCEADLANIWRPKGTTTFYLAASFGVASKPRERSENVQYLGSIGIEPGRGSIVARALLERKTVQIHDVQADPEYELSGILRIGDYRTLLAVPLLRKGVPIGVIVLTRCTVQDFTDKQIALVTTFADQAVIAIENVRLFDEVQARTEDLRESLQQQTATADVLKVISRSTFDLQTVLDTLVESATRLCDAERAIIWRPFGDIYKIAAAFNLTASHKEKLEELSIRPGRGTAIGRTLLGGKTVHIHDARTDPEYDWPEIERVGGSRTILSVPLVREGLPIGVLVLSRVEAQPFTGKQIELATSFADQAVIAIENVRLFDEVRARTDDLSESLQQQTATADVLKVISRSAFDLHAVFETLVESSVRLCGADRAFIFRFDGELLRMAAGFNCSPEFTEWVEQHPIRPGRHSGTARAALERRTIHIPDVLADPDYTYGAKDVEAIRTILGVPILKGDGLLGVIMIYHLEIRPFTVKQIALVETFADQAAIAIENVRLFDAEQQRTRELSESLEQQTATSEVLNVISNSLTDTQPVFEAIVQSGLKLFPDAAISVALTDGDMVKLAAIAEPDPARAEAWRRRFPNPLTRQYMHGAAILDRRIVDVPEVRKAVTEFAAGSRNFLASGYRAVTIMPMIRGSEAIGALSVVRLAPGPLSDEQLAVLRTFAAQAVIAIENTRLLSELRESLQQQTATADVLKVISRSTFDLPTVLQTLVESAARLCDADKATITRQKDGVFFRAETYGFSDEFMDYARTVSVVPDRGSAIGRALLEGVVVHIPDVQADPDYTFTEGQRLGGFRTILGVPMLREGVPIGVIVLTRSEARPFTDKQIELVATFADQAAIAIENVRLFESVEARTQELAKSLEDLRTAQDRLIQTEKLASLGQLTAGIAHEIKNPLNFVNNFSALSVELVDELDDVLKPATLDHKTRVETDELTQMLKGNLEKVVQHGKRADLIVKNMLLHSREGSTERRLVNLNGLVEECLNLAYHGARAENREFKIKLERSLDPTVGKVDLFPQEMTRVLLNLISNGFYAVTKRRAETKLNGYEPTLAAATKNLGDRVEIKIRDNGGGIPAEVRGKIFNPFFTTKPPGEGTGLGLSLSHDIVVKQHAGSIEVDTEPGEFTEFKINLPRTAATSNAGAGR